MPKLSGLEVLGNLVDNLLPEDAVWVVIVASPTIKPEIASNCHPGKVSVLVELALGAMSEGADMALHNVKMPKQ